MNAFALEEWAVLELSLKKCYPGTLKRSSKQEKINIFAHWFALFNKSNWVVGVWEIVFNGQEMTSETDHWQAIN